MMPRPRTAVAALLAASTVIAAGCGGTDPPEVRRFAAKAPSAVAADARGVYIGQEDGTVTRREIDGDVAVTMAVGGRIAALAVGGSSLVSLVEPGNRLVSVDARDFAPRARRHFDRGIVAIAHGAGHRLWVAFSGGTVRLLDDETLRTAATRSIPGRPRILALAPAGDAVYALTAPEGVFVRLTGPYLRLDTFVPAYPPRTGADGAPDPACPVAATGSAVVTATRDGVALADPVFLHAKDDIAGAGRWALIDLDGDRLIAIDGDGTLHRLALDGGGDTRIADLGPAARCGVAWGGYAFVLAPDEDAVLVTALPEPAV